jgi:hypothetical protein
LLRVDPERCFFTPPSKAGLGAAEWVKYRIRQILFKNINEFSPEPVPSDVEKMKKNEMSKLSVHTFTALFSPGSRFQTGCLGKQKLYKL